MKFVDHFLSLFQTKPQTSSILFIDGDMPLGMMKIALSKLDSRFDQIKIFRILRNEENVPKLIRGIIKEYSETNRLDYIQVKEWRKGKESTDKFMIAAMLKSVLEGSTDIGVLTTDYDFVSAYDIIDCLSSKKDFKYSVFIPKKVKADLYSNSYMIEYI